MYIIVTMNQFRVDPTLRFDLEGHLEGNEGKTNFPFNIHSLSIFFSTSTSMKIF